jgi:hypothetical protein
MLPAFLAFRRDKKIGSLGRQECNVTDCHDLLGFASNFVLKVSLPIETNHSLESSHEAFGKTHHARAGGQLVDLKSHHQYLPLKQYLCWHGFKLHPPAL